MPNFLDLMLVTVSGLLPIMNPFSTAVLFLSITKGMTDSQRRGQALLGCLYAFGILAVFLVAGQAIISFFGISIPGIRIAGGLVILTIGYRMLFPEPETLSPAAAKEARESDNIAFTPLAMPSLSGPGSIAVVLGAASEIDGSSPLLGGGAILVAIALTALICYLVLNGASRFVRFLGVNGLAALTKIMGFILIAMAVQFIFSGIKDFAKQL